MRGGGRGGGVRGEPQKDPAGRWRDYVHDVARGGSGALACFLHHSWTWSFQSCSLTSSSASASKSASEDSEEDAVEGGGVLPPFAVEDADEEDDEGAVRTNPFRLDASVVDMRGMRPLHLLFLEVTQEGGGYGSAQEGHPLAPVAASATCLARDKIPLPPPR